MASRVLSNMLVRRGYRITIGETFGMSQRGGAVMSHIRVSARTQWSPQIPRGKADMVVALEPVEAIRVLMTYGNPKVNVVINTRPIYPVGVITGALDYPPLQEIEKTVRSLSSGAWFLDATDEAVEAGESDPGQHHHDRRRHGGSRTADRPGGLRGSDRQNPSAGQTGSEPPGL